MIVDAKSINDISSHFQPLAYSFSACNYSVCIESKVFSYSKNDDFNVKNLQQIFHEYKDKIQGEIEKTLVESALSRIKEEISDYPSYDYDNLTKNEGFAHFREKALWMIINKYFNDKPSIAYFHDPDSDSYFDFGVMWQFCYIFLNSGKGIVLSSCAFD